MAKIKPPRSEDEIKKMGLGDVRKAYYELTSEFNKIFNGDVFYCHSCNEFHTADSFYSDKRYASGLFPQCKKSLLAEATDYDKKTNTYIDNKEKTIAVFQKMDLPFVEPLYKSALATVGEAIGERVRQTAYSQMLVMVKSLPQYKGLKFANSEFDDDGSIYTEEVIRKSRKEIKKIFGSGFTESDYVYLQDQYDDWKARTQVDSKSQETYVVQICLQSLEIYKDRKDGKDVTNKLKALDTLMNSANLQPKQNVNNAATDALTFGQLIEKWENEQPIPEPDPEFRDVNNIGKLIRVFFSGWLCKALGIKNVYSQECEEYMAQYEVTKPTIQEEGSSSDIYDKLFGSEGE